MGYWMSLFLTILCIFSGIASILGIIYIYRTTEHSWFKKWCRLGFIMAFLLSCYVLLIPGTFLEFNVRQKVKFYKISQRAQEDGVTVTQEGEQIIRGRGPLSVKFPIPFSTPPAVEIINSEGYIPDLIPRVEVVTQFQFTVIRNVAHVYYDSNGNLSSVFYPDKFRWVAKGIPLEQIK